MTYLQPFARFLTGTITAAQAVLGGWLALLIRLWLAQAYLVAQVHAMMAGPAVAAQLSAPLSPGWWSAAVHGITASGPGLTVQAICPVLLALGLLSRPAAAAMLLQALLTTTPGVAPETQLFWAALLFRIVMAGPGFLALDNLMRGAGSVALPFAAPVQRAFAWSRLALGPVYQLGLRLWIAAAPAAIAIVAVSGARAMRPDLAANLPQMPSMVAALAPAAALLLAALLILGAGVRVVALVMLALVPLSQLDSGDTRLYWALLLATLLVHGAGRLSVDRWFAARLRRMAAPVDRSAWPHVVVVGGGFGGFAAVRGLRFAPCRITLVDQRNHNLFQPLLYQVATASLSPGDIAAPIRGILREQANVRVLLGEVTGVDTAARTVQLGDARIAYDSLVLATGARHSYFGHDEWEQFAPGLKTVEDGTTIRRRLLLAFEEAEKAATEAERRAWLTFVIVGGGPTGVELAGAISELARHGLQQEFRTIDPATAEVILVQSAPRLLPAFPEPLSEDAARALRHLGVDVRLDSRVEDVGPHAVTVAGHEIPARTVLWAAGVMASPAAAWLGVEPDRSGRVPVGADLSVAGHPDIFVVGDTAASKAWNGKAVPGLAPAAKQGGTYAAKVIAARLRSHPTPKPFRYRHLGSLATIGRQSAVADFGFIRVRGALAWWLWGAAHIAFLVGGRSRIVILVEWFWAYLTFRRGTQLITERR